MKGLCRSGTSMTVRIYPSAMQVHTISGKTVTVRSVCHAFGIQYFENVLTLWMEMDKWDQSAEDCRSRFWTWPRRRAAFLDQGARMRRSSVSGRNCARERCASSCRALLNPQVFCDRQWLRDKQTASPGRWSSLLHRRASVGIPDIGEDTELARMVQLSSCLTQWTQDPQPWNASPEARAASAPTIKYLHHLRDRKSGTLLHRHEFNDGVTLKHRISGRPLEIDFCSPLAMRSPTPSMQHTRGHHSSESAANYFLSRPRHAKSWTSVYQLTVAFRPARMRYRNW